MESLSQVDFTEDLASTDVVPEGSEVRERIEVKDRLLIQKTEVSDWTK